MGNTVKGVYFWLVFVLVTLFFLVAACPYLLFVVLLRRNIAVSLRRGVWLYGRCCIFFMRPVVPLKVDNPDIAQRNSPCILLPNHQSFLDLYLLGGQNARNLCLVVGGWPFRKLFFFSAFMYLAKYIKVGSERDNLNFIDFCRGELENGATLMCFPEGTRSRDGRLQPFHSGIFRVAAITGASVVPMVFHNTGAVCPPGTLKITPQPVRATLLSPLRADPELKCRQAAEDLRRRAHSAMSAVLEKKNTWSGQ